MEIDRSKTSVADVVRAASASAREQKVGDVAVATGTDARTTGEKAAPITLKAAKIVGGDPTVIYGIGGSVNLDLDEEIWDQKSMVTMTHDFCASDKRTFKANHGIETQMDLVETWNGVPIIKDGDATRSLKAGEVLTESMDVIGIDITQKATHWFVGVRPKDPAIVEAAKAGEIAGFSWGAFVEKKAVTP